MSDHQTRVDDLTAKMSTREFVTDARKATPTSRRNTPIGALLEMALRRLELEANITVCPGCGKYRCTCDE